MTPAIKPASIIALVTHMLKFLRPTVWNFTRREKDGSNWRSEQCHYIARMHKRSVEVVFMKADFVRRSTALMVGSEVTRER